MTLRLIGMTLRFDSENGEFRVNFIGGSESTAYYTDGLEDAIDTAYAMNNAAGSAMASKAMEASK